MKALTQLSLFALLTAFLTFSACKKEEEQTQTETTTNNNDTTTTSGSGSGGTTDTSNTGGGGTSTGTTKPSATTIRFASNGKDCGITDGYANQQHFLVNLIHLNLDKCNNDTYRPTLTLTFESGKNISPGTYTVSSATAPSGSQVFISSSKYNWTDWTATGGSVVVTPNANDTSKIDLELKSISMSNDNPSDTLNPASDILTGYIIQI